MRKTMYAIIGFIVGAIGAIGIDAAFGANKRSPAGVHLECFERADGKWILVVSKKDSVAMYQEALTTCPLSANAYSSIEG